MILKKSKIIKNKFVKCLKCGFKNSNEDKVNNIFLVFSSKFKNLDLM